MKKKMVALLFVLTAMLLCLFTPAMAEENKFYFDKTITKIFEGETLQPALIRQGDCREDGTLTFTTSRAKVATVDENGVITGVSKGSATITASLKTEKRTWKCTFEVTVQRKVTEIQVNESKLSLYAAADPLVAPLLSPTEDPALAQLPVLLLRVGQNQAVTASLLPKDANNRNFVLTTSDENIVKTRSNNFQPKAPGECIVTVQSVQNPEIFVTYRALVVQPVTKVQITAPAKSLHIGYTLQLTPEYTPANASVKAVTWSSENEKIATVDENGLVTGVSKGSTKIKAKASDGSGRYATYSITVMQQPTSIELSETDFILKSNSYKTLKATVLPKNANNKKVIWSSSDERIAKVTSGGRVNPVGPGTCTITCTSESFPSVYATATVTVHQLVEKITFPEKTLSVNVGETVNLFWNIEPSNVTNPAVTLTSSKTSVATVDETGLIHGLKRGETTITVTAQDGSKKKGTIKVKVLQPVEGVHMQNETLTVGVDESVTARAVLEPEDASNTAMTWTSEDPSIATVRGSSNKATVTGQRWGTTTITGVTEDGGYVTSATVKVGNYDKALVITDLYLSDNKIRITVLNQSNMNITKFYYTIEVYDMFGQPLPCNENGSHTFTGSYGYTLYEGDVTRHGRFYFSNFVRPLNMGRVVMRITGYRTDDGYSRDIRDSRQVPVEYIAPGFTWGTPVPEPTPAADTQTQP